MYDPSLQQIPPGRHVPPRRERGFDRASLIAVLIVLAVLLAGVRVADNIQSKGSPPAACQLFGGHWSLWGGWSCN